MAQSASVAKLSHRHEAILHFMLMNPTVSKGEIAERFNVTQAWLSVVLNSDAFVEARIRLTDVAFHETVLPMREKLMVAADKALDRLNQLTPFETDLDKVRKTAESTLAALGFGSPQKGVPGTVTNNTQINIGGNASPEVIRRARELIGVKRDVLEPNGPVRLLDTGPTCESDRTEQLEEQDRVLYNVVDAGDGGDGVGSGAAVRECGGRNQDPPNPQPVDCVDSGLGAAADGRASPAGEERQSSNDQGRPGADPVDPGQGVQVEGRAQRSTQRAGGQVAVTIHGAGW